jgi:hypothetical protein
MRLQKEIFKRKGETEKKPNRVQKETHERRKEGNMGPNKLRWKIYFVLLDFVRLEVFTGLTVKTIVFWV